MNDHDQAVEDMRSADLSPAMMAQAAAPKKTFFFERMGDGFVFACEEREAWEIVHNRSSWKRRDFRLLGTSDGTTYMRIVNESMANARRLQPTIQSKKEELKKYMRSEEQLIQNEAVDMEGDPEDAENESNKKKVLRLRAIIDRLHDEIDKLEEEYNQLVKDVVKRATAEERKVAEANQAERGCEWPDENANILTPDADPKQRAKILSVLQGRAK